MRILTIGVYGTNEGGFFKALRDAEIDVFCDIRWRRGVRGRDYAFVNSARLQKKLAQMGIRYRHFRELAPAPALRQCQAAADQEAGTAKRQRAALGETFVRAYKEQNLAAFDSRKFMEELGSARNAALFCVEREPGACHRSLLAERLRLELGLEIIHLRPELFVS